jgi:antitoxin component of RelBE/YafQ-DinJ toxin-antitoxin module
MSGSIEMKVSQVIRMLAKRQVQVMGLPPESVKPLLQEKMR